MKNKKGFTLVELLAVIVILAIVVLIAIPSLTTFSKNIKVKQRENLIKAIEKAASEYAFDGNSLDSSNKVTVEKLIDEGYLESDEKESITIYDPTDKNKTMNNCEVTVSRSGSYYVGKFDNLSCS